MTRPTVFLIGGAPGAGKTSFGQALATRINATSLTVDDLLTAVKAVTTPDSHPGLHVMSAVDSIEYFTETSVDRLTADASVQHEATWPAVERLVRKRAIWGPSIVIDGWALRPNRVVELGLANVKSFWLVTEPSVLMERERQNVEFFGRSKDPDRMLRNFLGRSLWYNDLIDRQAAELQLTVVRQDGRRSVEDLCEMALRDYEDG